MSSLGSSRFHSRVNSWTSSSGRVSYDSRTYCEFEISKSLESRIDMPQTKIKPMLSSASIAFVSKNTPETSGMKYRKFSGADFSHSVFYFHDGWILLEPDYIAYEILAKPTMGGNPAKQEPSVESCRKLYPNLCFLELFQLFFFSPTWRTLENHQSRVWCEKPFPLELRPNYIKCVITQGNQSTYLSFGRVSAALKLDCPVGIRWLGSGVLLRLPNVARFAWIDSRDQLMSSAFLPTAASGTKNAKAKTIRHELSTSGNQHSANKRPII